MNDINYYVSVSSFDKKQEANILIRVPRDEKYRCILNKEYQFCMNNTARIQKKADKIYKLVTTNRKQILTDNSCDFHILEEGYREYIKKEEQFIFV